MRFYWPISALLFLFAFVTSANASITLDISNPRFNGDYFTIDAVVDGLASSSACYVQGMFTSPSKTKYFGLTYNAHGVWQNYQSSPDPDTVKNDFISLVNGQTKQIFIKNDLTDPDYKGSGSYLLKLKRYTGNSASGSSAGESNELTVAISETTPSPTATLTSTPSPSSIVPTSPTTQNTPTRTLTSTSTPPPKVATPKPTLTTVVLSATASASVSAEVASPSALAAMVIPSDPVSTKIEPQSSSSTRSTYLPLALIVGGITLFLLSSITIFLQFRSQGSGFAKISKYG